MKTTGYCSFIKEFTDALKAHPALEREINVITISSGGWATHEWSLDTVFKQILNCDVAIIPLPDGVEYSVKSTNRLTMFMALGMPVIATPIPSYVDIVTDHKNSIFAKTLDDYAIAINMLESKDLRRKLGIEGRLLAQTNYNQTTIGRKWINTCASLNTSPSQPRHHQVTWHTKLLNTCLSFGIVK